MAEEQFTIFRQAIESVRAAGQMLAASDTEIQIRQKGKTDFVTQLDLAVQTKLHDALLQIAPEYQLMGEEQDNSKIDRQGKLWILDPVDGTTNLIHHFCHSAISLAMVENGVTIGGIVYQPYSDEMFTSFAGQGAYCNGKPIHVSGSAVLQDSLFSVGTNPGCRQNADRAFSLMRAFYERCHDIRRIGAASIEICYVAAGRLDGYLEHGLKPWDYAAGELILREAGGCCTDWSGKAPTCGTSADILVTNGAIHTEALSLLG